MDVGKITGIALALALVAVTVPMDDLSATGTAEAEACILDPNNPGEFVECEKNRCDIVFQEGPGGVPIPLIVCTLSG